MKLLFVNCCIRGEKSRTLELCRDFIRKLGEKHPDFQLEEIDLTKENLEATDLKTLNDRDALLKKKSFDAPMFDYAKQFIAADLILIGAPYWDLQFPAKLKIYLEKCSVTGLTFIYDEKGVPEGQCKAKGLVYITTSGSELTGMNFGYDYIQGLMKLFGVEKTYFAAAENLDIIGNDVRAIMEGAKEKISEIIKEI